MNICMYGAASSSIDKIYLDSVYELAAKMAERGHSLVFGGGANGVMGAAARGMHDNDGEIIGIAPSFFNVDGILYDKCTEFVYTETMRQRKQLLEERSDAFIIAPGGLGTYDEFFDILTLKQLEKHNKPIVLYNVNGYYDIMIKLLENTAEHNFMKAKNMELIGCFDNAADLLDYIENYDLAPISTPELRDVN